MSAQPIMTADYGQANAPIPPGPRRNSLLMLGILVANLTIGLLVWRLTQLSHQVESLEQSLAQENAHRTSAEALLERTLTALESTPSEANAAAALRTEQRILLKGDPRLLSPKDHPEIKQIFDELL